MFTPGSRTCAYKTASGRGKWPNRDPIQEAGGLNLYTYVANNPIYLHDVMGLSGTLTIDVRAGGGIPGLIGSSGGSGHAWITYKPDNGTITTYGTYEHGALGYNYAGGLLINQEVGETPDVCLTTHLDDAHEKALMELIDHYSMQFDDAWGYTHPCTSFANDSWSTATGQSFDLGVLKLPSVLANDIRNYVNAPISITTPPTVYNRVNTPDVYLPKANK
jgi:hypothetical protein